MAARLLPGQRVGVPAGAWRGLEALAGENRGMKLLQEPEQGLGGPRECCSHRHCPAREQAGPSQQAINLSPSLAV